MPRPTLRLASLAFLLSSSAAWRTSEAGVVVTRTMTSPDSVSSTAEVNSPSLPELCPRVPVTMMPGTAEVARAARVNGVVAIPSA